MRPEPKVPGDGGPRASGAPAPKAPEGGDPPVSAAFELATVKFNEQGLVPVIAQDADSRRVLMLAWANREALEKSLRSKEMTYWSRSRSQLWTKGETSGARQRLVELRLDCDGDAVLALVQQAGNACHTGARTCWETKEPLPADALDALRELTATIASRKASPKAGSYTNELLADLNLARKKVAEEATEVVMASAAMEAAKPPPSQGEPAGSPVAKDTANLVHESADVLYHLLALLAAHDVPLEDVMNELASRRK